MTHKGHSIVIRDDPGRIDVRVDGREVRVFGSADGYWTPFHAYERFASLDDLGRAVAEVIGQPE
jgi:hypothetical protein